MNDSTTKNRGRLTIRHFAGPLSHVESFESPVRVAHLTDQHVGRMTSMRLQRDAIQAVNEARPDVVALTGDFVAHGLGFLDALQELLQELEVPAYAVLGNHDHWSGPDEVRLILERAGIEVLDNAWTTIQVKGAPLQIVGIDDAYTGNDDIDLATKGLQADLPTLALAHVPESADALWERGADLVLSGHTHGGQVALGRGTSLSVAALAGHRYIHGLYGDRRGPGALYVNAGIGAAVFPLRMGARSKSEMAIFELGVAPGAIQEHHGEQPALAGRLPTQETTTKRHLDAFRRAEKHRRKLG